MSERHYFNIDDPMFVLENADRIAMLSDYTFSDADKQELQTFNYIRWSASEKILQAFATKSTLVRTLQYKYKEQRRKEEQRRRRRWWWEEHRKKVIITAIIAFVVLLIIGGEVAKKAYDDNYDAYVNDYVINQAQNGELRFKVSIRSERTEYNHLGTNIIIEHTVNNQLVKNGDILPETEELRFRTVITERDGIDDVGYQTSTMTLPDRYRYVDASFSRTITQNITVREDGGKKYPNAYARYEVTITVTPYIDEEQIDFWDVVFYK